MSNLILSPYTATNREAPEWFTIALRGIDPSLIVFFNPLRSRWIIDRCTAGGVHRQSDHHHSPECPRTNVRVIKGEGGEYMPLCQEVLDWLRAHDTWNQHGSDHNFITHLDNEHSGYQDKLRAERRDNTRAHTLDNKRQLQQMKNLIDQHDLELNR